MTIKKQLSLLTAFICAAVCFSGCSGSTVPDSSQLADSKEISESKADNSADSAASVNSADFAASDNSDNSDNSANFDTSDNSDSSDNSAAESQATDSNAATTSSQVPAQSIDEDLSLRKVKDSGKLVLGIDNIQKPLIYNDEEDIVGFSIDVMKEIGSRLGAELEIKAVSPDNSASELSSGTFDCICINSANENAADMLVTDCFLSDAKVYAVNGSSDAKTSDDLIGGIVSVRNGSDAQKVLEAQPIAGEIMISAEMVDYDSLDGICGGFSNAVFINKTSAYYDINKNGRDCRVLAEEIDPVEYVIGFAGDSNELKDEVQKILDEMRSDGAIAAISEEWFGCDISGR